MEAFQYSGKTKKRNRNLRVWISAFRLRTLPLALSSIIMAGFLAAYIEKFDLIVFLLCILTTLFLQILSNLANDYGDAKSGVDLKRKGPERAVQSGQISENAMRRAITVVIGLSLLSGIWLLWEAVTLMSFDFVVFLGLGILAIFAAITYTHARRPYGYMGLGDVSVLLFFGIVGVLGSLYLQAGLIYWDFLLPALSCGFFATAVLNVNNIRDIESDRKARKRSIPVRLGRKNAVIYHWGLLFFGFVSAAVFVLINYNSYLQFLFILTLPLLYINAQGVSENHNPQALDPYLRQMALTTLFFVITFGLGLLFSA